MNPVKDALASQDILHNILSLSTLSQQELLACCLVNSDWAAAGLFLLWRYPRCWTFHSFQLLLNTLRHEIDYDGPIPFSPPPLLDESLDLAQSFGQSNFERTTAVTGAAATTTATSAGSSGSPMTLALRRAVTMRERSGKHGSPRLNSKNLLFSAVSTPAQSSFVNNNAAVDKRLNRLSSFMPTPIRPRARPKEYGIPFHGERIYHRGRFIRRIDFAAIGKLLSDYHFEILARSTDLGFRSLDLQTVRLQFSEHLLAILSNSKFLRQLILGNMFIPLEALNCLAPCFQALKELRLVNCPDSMGDEALSVILENSTQLTVLEIHGESFTDMSLQLVAIFCQNLETLVIECPKMTDLVVERIAESCTKLESWTLIDCTRLANGTLGAFEHKYGSVQDKTRGYGGAIFPSGTGGGAGQQSLPPPPPSTSITSSSTTGAVAATSSSSTTSQPSYPMGGLGQHGAFPSSSVPSSAVSSPSTSSVSSHSDSEGLFSNAYGSNIEHQQQQHHHHHHHQLLPPPVFKHVDPYFQYSRGPRLTTIDLRNCTAISPRHINDFLRSQPKLEHLTLGGISITDEALEALTEISYTDLKSLGLIDCGEISDETMVAVMFNCDQLQKLTLFGGANFTLKTFTSISLHLAQLEELHLEHVPLIMNESIQEILLKCPVLRILRLWHCRNLTSDLIMDDLTPCPRLEVLEYMDKFARPFVDDGWDTQVRFLRSLVMRFERLRCLSLAKLADVAIVPVNLVSYLCQLDQLEKFSIIQSPGLDLIDLNELHDRLPTLTDLGIGQCDNLTESEVLMFNQNHMRPCVRVYRSMLESSEELRLFQD
ncbi:hypothetical protein BGZ83_003652 [Gryganskiella cystojenkinii]|nr:hypothetical protein BGZ83_003652 [Gryganskiella cystojenkinii]